MTKEKSGFGKGMVVCLVKFAEHVAQFHQFNLVIINKWIKADEKNRADMISDNPSPGHNYGFPHMKQLKHFVEKSDKIYDGNYEKSFSSDIETVMNGASDHLYDLEVPEGKKWDKIREQVLKLRDKGLRMGHGFEKDTIWDFQDASGLFALTREIAVMIDKELGLEAEEGEY